MYMEVSLHRKALAPRTEQWPEVGEAAEVAMLHNKDPFSLSTETIDRSEIFCLLVFISIF